jgi:hypothetical protein
LALGAPQEARAGRRFYCGRPAARRCGLGSRPSNGCEEFAGDPASVGEFFDGAELASTLSLQQPVPGLAQILHCDTVTQESRQIIESRFGDLKRPAGGLIRVPRHPISCSAGEVSAARP